MKRALPQVIIRPNEPYAGKLPNEDAQSWFRHQQPVERR
jgi:hypothetical protein